MSAATARGSAAFSARATVPNSTTPDVYKGVPAPTNLVIPPYKFLNDNLVLVGDDSEGAS